MFFTLRPMFTLMLVSCSQFDVSTVIRGPTRKYKLGDELFTRGDRVTAGWL